MKVNELRIGNWIYDRSMRREGKAWSIRPDRRNRTMINDTDLEFIKPIPITPDWLERFGFEVSRTEPDFWEKENISGSFFSGEFQLTWYELAPCRYVHQLQNLYFALTGEELTIKE